eukprot:4563702-Amphidinium_carterae.1
MVVPCKSVLSCSGKATLDPDRFLKGYRTGSLFIGVFGTNSKGATDTTASVSTSMLLWYVFIVPDSVIMDVSECSGIVSGESEGLVLWSCNVAE